MNHRTKVLVGLWVAATGLIAWIAAGPDPYLDQLGIDQPPYSYPWLYPAIFLVLGGIILALLRPWQNVHSFVGATIAFITSFILSIYLAITAMHAHPVHGSLFLAVVAVSFALLFYSGFAFSQWRSDRRPKDSAY